MRGLKTFALSVTLLALIAGCAPAAPPTIAEADIRGTITHLDPAGSILIEGVTEQDTEFDRASVTVTAETRIYRLEEGNLLPATFASLQVGQRVQAAFTGPVMESYPVQATASQVVILSDPVPGAAGPSPLPEPTQSPLPLPQQDTSSLPSYSTLPPAASAARNSLAAELGLSTAEVTVLSYETVDWPDSSLGCPQPGTAYIQVITPGYRVILQARGQQYEVHTDDVGQATVICGRPSDAEPKEVGTVDDVFRTVLAYLSATYPGFGLDQQEGWAKENRTPAGLVGASTFAWRSGEWTLEVSYPVVMEPTYQVALSHAQASVVWSGTVSAAGEVTPASTPVTLTSAAGPCDESIPLDELDTWAGVEVTAQNGAIHIEQNLFYVCCAELALSAGQEGATIKVIETNVGEVCRCMCGYSVRMDLTGLPSGRYTVEVWGVQHRDVHPLELLGSAEVTIP